MQTILTQPYPLKTQHIKWAYVLPGKPGVESAKKLIQRVCLMLITEIMRTDEVGVICLRDQPLSGIKFIDTAPPGTFPESAGFYSPGMSWEPLFRRIEKQLLENTNAAGVISLNVLFFRPQTNESFDMNERFGGYSKALRLAARVETVAVAYTLTNDPSIAKKAPPCVAAAHVDRAVASNFITTIDQVNRFGNRKQRLKQLETVLDAVNGWTQGVYTIELEEQFFKEKNSYSYAPDPIEFEGAEVAFGFYVTSDEEVIEDPSAPIAKQKMANVNNSKRYKGFG